MSEYIYVKVGPGQHNAMLLGMIEGPVTKEYCVTNSTTNCGEYELQTVISAPPNRSNPEVIGGYNSGVAVSTTEFNSMWGSHLRIGDLVLYLHYAEDNVGTDRNVRLSVPDGYAASFDGFSGTAAQGWYNAKIVMMPALNLSGVTNFSYAWSGNRFGSNFPAAMNVENGTNFNNTWSSAGISTFPNLNLSNGVDFTAAWMSNPMGVFQVSDLSSGEIFDDAWRLCSIGYDSSQLWFPENMDMSSAISLKYAWASSAIYIMPGVAFTNALYFNFAWYNSHLRFVADGFSAPAGIDFTNAFNSSRLASMPEVEFASGEVFDGTWAHCDYLMSFPACSFPVATNMQAAWYKSKLTSFGACTFGGTSIDFDNAWASNRLTSFPPIDLSGGATFNEAWYGNQLATFPDIDMSNAVDLERAWYNNYLTGWSITDFSAALVLKSAWAYNKLESFPLISCPLVADISQAWMHNKLTTFPAVVFPAVTDASSAWADNELTEFLVAELTGCVLDSAWKNNKFTSFPLINTEGCTSAIGGWESNLLTSFPPLDLSYVEDLSYAWKDNLFVSFPGFVFTSAIKLREAWKDNSLTSFPMITIPAAMDFRGAWANNPITVFPKLAFKRSAIHHFELAWDGCLLNQQSLENVLTSLDETDCTMIQTAIGYDGQPLTPSAQAALTSLGAKGCIIALSPGGVRLAEVPEILRVSRWEYLSYPYLSIATTGMNFVEANREAIMEQTLAAYPGPYKLSVYSGPMLHEDAAVPIEDRYSTYTYFLHRDKYNSARAAPSINNVLLIEVSFDGNLVSQAHSPIHAAAVASGTATHARITAANGKGVSTFSIPETTVVAGVSYGIREFNVDFGLLRHDTPYPS